MRKTMVALLVSVVFALGACAPMASDSSSIALPDDYAPVPIPAITATSIPTPVGHMSVTALNSSVQVFDGPGIGTRELVLHQEDFIYGDTRLTFGVISRQGDWLQVMLPGRPNGSTGWISIHDVWVDSTSFSIVVDKSDKILILNQGSQEVERFDVGTGKPSTRTPTGMFYVFWRSAVIPADGPYGPYQLVLNAHSEDMEMFNAFGAWIGAHGTNDPSSIGEEASNGCIHMFNSDIARLFEYYDIPVGTPVEIRE